MSLDCEHCRALRALVDASTERVGRPPDSYDRVETIPRASVPSYAAVEDCPCDCHAHLSIVGRRPRRTS